MPRLAFVVASLIAFAGCEKLNPLYCSDDPHPSGPGCIANPDAQSEPDAPRGPCQANNDCTGTPNTPVCDMKQSPHMCVQCTDEEQALCTGTAPFCRNNSCVAACGTDSDCGTGGLCLPGGACTAADNIIHAISIGGMNVQGCGVPGGPGACTLERALTEVINSKNVIKLDDKGPYTPATNNFVVNNNVTIDARGPDAGGAVLHPSHNNNPILTTNDSTVVTILGGTIEGATNVTNNDGILCGPNATLTIDGTTFDTIEKSAINAGGSCNLTITNATISHTSLKDTLFAASVLATGDSVTLLRSSLHSNKGGGIKVTKGTFVIVGNTFSNNGGAASPVGGVLIGPIKSNPTNRIEFNTIANNYSLNPPGVDCTVGTGPVTIAIARNNIIWDNNGNVGPQVGGTCKHAYSDIGMTDIGGANDDGSNLSMDPMFVVPIYDLHLQPNSPMVMHADLDADIDGVAAKDLDGDLRIAPADIGFDQRPR